MNQVRRLLRVQPVVIPEQRIVYSKQFPLVLSPDLEPHGHSTASFTHWIRHNINSIQTNLTTHGALLFRKFHLPSAESFDESIKALGYPLFNYCGGTAFRRVVTGNVATASEVDPAQTITFHHEKAYTADYPKICLFYCNIAPQEGGQTPIAHSHELYQYMRMREPALVEKLEREGVRYTRILPEHDDPSAAIGLGWKSSFQTDDKLEAERRANAQGTTFQWLPNGDVKTVTNPLPGIYTDSRTGNKTWLNAITTAYLGWQDARNDRKKAVTFGGGDLLPEGGVQTLLETLEEIAVDFPWQQGDLLMVDNRQALHGRRPYTPPRKILACLCDDHQP